ncbi:MAG TPA: urease accessory protein UreE [Polyangia bacterium]|nr:urease accessory protein UreE [Polyangia bacterium]
MLRLTQVVRGVGVAAVDGVLTLPFADRRRSRMRVRLDDGREAALILPHGTVLRDGDRLQEEGGTSIVSVRAADETLSWATTGDSLLLARAAYHLGNRHVPVQLGEGWVAYQHDHVLDGMIAELGLRLEVRRGPFEPEAGGYRQAGAAPHHHHHGGHAHEH